MFILAKVLTDSNQFKFGVKQTFFGSLFFHSTNENNANEGDAKSYIIEYFFVRINNNSSRVLRYCQS